MPREFFFNLKCKTNLGKASNWFECFAEVLPVISKRSLGRIDAPERAFQM